MSVKVIAELHPARRDKTITYTGAGTVSEILSRLDTGFTEEHARVCLNGAIVRDFSVRAGDGDTLWIKFVFYGSDNQSTGNAMKGGGAFLAVLGFIVAAVAGWTGVGAFIGMAMIGAGLGMVAGGAALFNINIPSLKDREKPENDPSVRGGRNQARLHGRIPVLFGRHRLYPDLAATPYTEIEGNAQYFTQLFCGGYRDCAIDTDTFKLGETSLVKFSHSKDIGIILSGNDPVIKLEILQNGEGSALYPRCVNEQMLNAVLKHEADEGDGVIVSGEIIRDTPDNTDAINVDIFFYGGLGKYNNSGDLKETSVEVAASYKREGDPDSAYQLLGYFAGTGNTISGSELKTKRCQVTKPGLAPGKYTVKVERVTEDSDDVKVTDTVYVGSIRAFKEARPIRPERQKDLTIVALRVRATDKLNGAIDAFNYVATAKIPVYDNSGGTGPFRWTAAAQTRNPAAALFYALKGRASQQAVDDADIDYPALERFFSWCRAHSYFCDAYLAESVTISELFRMIGGTARAEILRLDSRISVVQDIERDSPVQLFTPKNTISYSETMLLADIPDAISLRFINEESGYAENELTVYNTPSGNRAAEPETTQKVDLWGVTDSKQARRVGMYSYGCLKNRPFVRTIEADIEYLLCNKGDWIQYAGDIALAGTTQGRVTGIKVSGDLCTGFYTDEPIVMEAGKQYGVRVRRSDGGIILKPVTFFNNPQNEIVFDEPAALSPPLEPGNVYAFGVMGMEVVDCIITDIQPQADLAATLTCVDYSPEVFGVDEPDFILPDYVNKVSPVTGAIDSGTVNPDNWKFYQTFHDGEGMPARPAGDGQGGGWHLEPTVASKWQSGKTAPSRESGVWSAPVRITGEKGEPGTPALVHEIIPSVSVIKKYLSGKIEPSVISCRQQTITGGGLPTESSKTLKYITSEDDEETLYTEPVEIGDSWEWIEFRLYDGNVLLDRETVPVLSDGPPATRYELAPSVPLIVRDTSGAARPSAITCSQRVITGTKPPEKSDKRLVYVTSANGDETEYSGPVAVTWDWIEFRLYDGNKLLDSERVFVLQEGEPAKAYELQPSASVIKVYDGITEPYKISCAQVSITGNGLPVPSDKTLKYATPLSDEQPYTGEITVNPLWPWIEFRLYDEDVLLDKERVPVLANGASLIYLDLENQNITVRADEYGEPYGLPLTTQAVLYNGNIPVTDAAFKASLEEKNIVYYPGDTFDPMLGGFYPIETSRWFLSKNYVTSYEIARYPGDSGDIFDPMPGGFYPVQKEAGFIQPSQASIDRNGLITINQLTDDEATIIVSAKYRDAVYSAPLTLIRVKDAERPVIIDIENENTSVACDAYGAPYPGELPLVTKAIFYKGTEPVIPFWFLDTPARGISIAQDGTITVAENAGLGRSNNIPVMAAYRGKTYTRMLTITKALEGFAATVYELLPGARVVRRDAAGNSSPAALSCSQQKTSGNDAPESAGKTLVYVTSASPEETPYTGPVTVGSLSWIEFRLRDGGTILDQERVPVVSDGEGSITIDLENENTTVRCDAYGAPYPDSLPLTTKAVLYDGWDEAAPAWSLESPPAGVSIAGNGTITVAKGAALGNINNIRVKAQYKGASYTHVFTIGKTLDGESSVTLDILPDNEVIQCDYLGNPLRGLPLEAKATLYKGTLEVTAAMELAEAAKVDIIHYPGNIFDPMLGGFYPALGYPVAWSLSGAPAGVTIDRYGLITVSGTASLSDINRVTVKAAYHGKTYEAVFGVVKARGGAPGMPGAKGNPGDPALVPRYRGVTLTADTGNTGKITAASGSDFTANEGDWVLFMGASGWTKYYLYQWNGKIWVRLDRERNVSKYADAIDDITDQAPDGIFSAVFCRMLFAQQAAINTLRVQLAQIGTAIFGGERFSKADDGVSIVDKGADKQGIMIGADGRLIASNANISGTINANNGNFENVAIKDAIVSGNSLFQGDIDSGPLILSPVSPSSAQITYNSGTDANAIYQNEKTRLGFTEQKEVTTINSSVSGTYNNKGIIKIRYYHYKNSNGYNESSIYVYYVNGDDENIARFTSNGSVSIKLAGTLSFVYVSGGKTFRLIDLPSEPSGLSGTVYREGNLLKIVP